MEEKNVIIKGLDIPFWDLVIFLIKIALASIPAIFIISTLFWGISLLFGTFIFRPMF